MDPAGLKAVPLFSSLSDEDLELVAMFVSEVSVSARKHLVDEGDYAYELFVIQEGVAEVFRGDEKLNELGPGQFFGEMGLLDKAQRNATVIAKTPMRLATLSHWDVTRLRKRWPHVYEQLREVTEARKAS